MDDNCHRIAYDVILFRCQLDFWQPPSHLEALVDIVVSPDNVEAFVGDLRAKGLSYVVAIKDLDQ